MPAGSSVRVHIAEGLDHDQAFDEQQLPFIILSFLPTPMDILGGLDTCMLLRGLVYWAIAIVLTIVTKGTLGWVSENTKYLEWREQRVALG